jgi:hypothetical protein
VFKENPRLQRRELATYVDLVPGADISFVDRLDEKPENRQLTAQQSATPAQPSLGAGLGKFLELLI